jgi:hypothetical protein
LQPTASTAAQRLTQLLVRPQRRHFLGGFPLFCIPKK